jgi:hypothetical protein
MSVGVSSAILCASNTPVPPAEGTETIPKWEAEFEDKSRLVNHSTSQVPSPTRYGLEFEFIDDLKTEFMLLLKKRRLNIENPVAKHAKCTGRGATKKRRPRNAFILYRTVLQAQFGLNGNIQSQLSGLIAASWKNGCPRTRAHFERLAELEKGKWFVCSFIDTTVFGHGAADILGCETEDGFDRVHDSRTARVLQTEVANVTTNENLYDPMHSQFDIIPLEQTRQELPELPCHEQYFAHQPFPSYDWAMAPTISAWDPLPTDRLEAMRLVSPGQNHRIEDAGFPPSHNYYEEWMYRHGIDTRPDELTSDDGSVIVYPPYHVIAYPPYPVIVYPPDQYPFGNRDGSTSVLQRLT